MTPKHSFGGSALDRHLFHFETDLSGMGADPAAGVPAPPDPAPAADPVDPAPAADPAPDPAPAFSPDDPAFLEAVQREAAQIVQAQLAQNQPAAQPQGDPVDWADVMNPLSENYNPEQFYAARDKYILSQVAEMIRPLTESAQQTQATQSQQLVDQFITDRWTPADGDLTDDHKAAIRDLAPAYLEEMNRRYGQGPIAAGQAITKATEMVRKINQNARGAGSQANIDALAAVASAAGEPGNAAGVSLNNPAPARSPAELLARRFSSPMDPAAPSGLI